MAPEYLDFYRILAARLFWTHYWGVPFFSVTAEQYAEGIPTSILVNTFGAGLPVVILMHVVVIPRLMLVYESKLVVISVAGFFMRSSVCSILALITAAGRWRLLVRLAL